MDFLFNLFLLKIVNLVCPNRSTGQTGGGLGWFAMGTVSNQPIYDNESNYGTIRNDDYDNDITPEILDRPMSIMEREDRFTFENDPFLNGESDFDPEW